MSRFAESRLGKLQRKLRRIMFRHGLSHWPRRALQRPEPVVVLVPLVAKDLRTAPTMLASLRRHLLHPIDAVVVVGPDDPDVRAFAQHVGANFFAEHELLPEAVQGLHYVAGGRDRNGWVRQQTLKLLWPEFLAAERVLVFDADTRLVRPLAFIDPAGRRILFTADDYEAGYADLTERVLGPGPRHRWSFVAHCMLMERQWLTALHAAISQHAGGQPWLPTLITAIDRREPAGLSEFDLYGTFVYRHHRSAVRPQYWYNSKCSLEAFLCEPAARSLQRFNFLSAHNQPPRV